MAGREQAGGERQGRTPSVAVEALGQSEAFFDFQERLARVAPIDRPVLLVGERGTGKELAAARLHYLSRRWQGPFVSLNCAALTASLIEAELFGHERGAFTGAAHRRKGRFESAHDGTLFLDEIGLIPFEVQEKILRVVEYGSFERVGSSEPVDADARIIGATNADLVVLAGQGRFKQDLLDRLAFEVLFLPPLRERLGDIPLLAAHFAARMAVELGRKEIPEFGSRAMETLNGHLWPGNIRELKNVVERSVYRSDAAVITDIEMDPFRAVRMPAAGEDDGAGAPKERTIPGVAAPRRLKEAVWDLERQMLTEALEAAQYNQKKAAGSLGLTYDQFRGLRRKHADRI
ncbi:MAG: phage shock protein operon transcriptional activator [Desulfobacterales bacterium]|nr:phage shock protein operon transcriptional activator [Desulfobacterales bacterium]